MIELKHCPFCGGEAGIEIIPMNNGEKLFSATCSRPDICDIRPHTRLCKTPEEAMAIWNYRVDMQSEHTHNDKINNHEVACILADLFDDDCACNYSNIDSWLPEYCDFANTCCPNTCGVACWEQFLKYRDKKHG